MEKTVSVELLPQTFAWGDAFEHWIILELIKGAEYRRLDWDFSYLRTKDDVEIDLIISRPGCKDLFIEIKSKSQVFESDAKALETLGRDTDPEAEKWLISCDPLARSFGKTKPLFWQDALKELFLAAWLGESVQMHIRVLFAVHPAPLFAMLSWHL